MSETPIPKKKDTAEIKPESQEPIETPSTPEVASPFTTSIADAVRTREEKLARQRAEREKLLQDISTARDAQGSFVSNYFKLHKPQYDADAEKRQLQAARIRAIGDALGLVASGFAAFGKNGAGYVPKFESSVVEDIEKINKARETYLQQNKEWKDFEYKQHLAELQAKTKAAEALLESKDKEIEDTREEIADYEQALQRYQSDKEVAAIKAEQALEKQQQGHTQKMEQIGKRTEGAIAAKQAGAAAKEKGNDAKYFALWKALNPDETEKTVVEGGNSFNPKTTTKPKRYSKNEETQYTAATKSDWTGRYLDKLMSEGMSQEAAIADIAVIANAVKQLVEKGHKLDDARNAVIKEYEAKRQK